MLNIKVPLLHIGPDRFVGNGNECQRSRGSAQRRRIDVGVANDVRYGCSLRKRVVLLQGSGIGLALIGMFEEDAVPPTNGPFPVAFRIEGETEARRRVKQMPLHTTGRYAGGNAAVYPSVVLRIRYGASYEIIGIGEARPGN